ncbi:MAG: PorV/PorQ family protein [bacterium]|nr:PorV/PorQ family protein [bacterium]
MRYVTGGAIILALLWTCPVSAEEADGGYAGSFMQVPVGARPAALGGAYRSISDDGAGPLYNPAGVASLPSPIFSSAYRVMQLDRSLGYITGLFPTSRGAVIGVNWLFSGSGNVAARNKDGDLLGSDISANNHSIGVVFAKRFEEIVSAGAKISYLHSELGELKTFTVGIDVGFVLYASHFFDRETRETMSVQDIRFGLTVKNLNSNYRWDTGDIAGNIGVIQDDKVPLEFALSGSARFLNRKLVLASDLVKNTEQSFRLYSGTEYFVYPEFALRAGLSDGSFTAGTGYLIKLGSKGLAIDYAFTTDKVGEGSEHIFSFDLIF